MGRKKQNSKEVISVRVPKDVKRGLARLAAQNQKRFSDYVRNVLESYLRDEAA